MAMRQVLFAAAVFILATTTLSVAAPTLPPAASASPPNAADVTATNGASLVHSALKATTFKVGSTITNLAILSYAAGDFVGGAALTTFILASSWVIYTTNDYLWDSYAPPPERQTNHEAFDASADVWRNTGKFLTYKPVIASIKLVTLYAYTGSLAVTTIFGTASILTNTVVFYANNMAWDLYDWYAGSPVLIAKR
jgi:uncharacterized membrane protein